MQVNKDHYIENIQIYIIYRKLNKELSYGKYSSNLKLFLTK